MEIHYSDYLQLDKILAECNAALKTVPPSVKTSLKAKIALKQKQEGKSSVTEADRRRWELPDADFEHWTIPFDTDVSRHHR